MPTSNHQTAFLADPDIKDEIEASAQDLKVNSATLCMPVYEG